MYNSSFHASISVVTAFFVLDLSSPALMNSWTCFCDQVGVKAHGTAKRMAFFPAVREETGIDRARTRREWSRGVCLRWKWRRRWWLSRSCGCYWTEGEIRSERVCEGKRPCLWRLGRWMVWFLTDCGVTFPGGAEQSCLILWSPHTGKKSGDVKQVRWVQTSSIMPSLTTTSQCSHDLSFSVSPTTWIEWNCEYKYVSLNPLQIITSILWLSNSVR